jgi:hypothetical protein
LIGDDPDALKIMLGFAYDPQIRRPAELLYGATDTINHFLGLYRVGDKYQFPAFLDRVDPWLTGCMYDWLDRSTGPFDKDSIARSEFCGFVRDIYELVGLEHRPSHPLVHILLELATDRGSASVLNNTGGHQPLIVTALQEVAEFGRDVLLHLMGKTGSWEVGDKGDVVSTELCIGVELGCLVCEKFWWDVTMDDAQEPNTVCTFCESDP